MTNVTTGAAPKKILYIDMDNVLVDFRTGIARLTPEQIAEHESRAGRDAEGNLRDLDDVPGIFALMDPIPGAVDAVHALSPHFDIYVLSTAPWNNPTAWSDKLMWIKRHFGESESSPLHKRLILSHHKNLNDGHFLVDDRVKHGAAEFGSRPHSEHIYFGQPGFEDWDAITRYLLESR